MNKLVIFCQAVLLGTVLLVLTGCLYTDEPLPKIVQDYPQQIPKPVQPKPLPPDLDFNKNIPRYWLPSKNFEKPWSAIIIHHSATRNGSAAIFDKWHREDRHWNGVGYHFVIGNGTDTGNGLVEPTYRWTNQQTGAHCGGTRNNWANKNGIGICLVGNFDKTTPTWRQMRSLTSLVKVLSRRYKIPKSKIYGHRTTPGARTTECPGRKFPMAKLKSMLDN